VNALTNFLLRAGPTRLFAALGVTALVAAALFALLFRMGGEEKALLFSNIDMKEAGQITEQLDTAGIKYELKGDGSSIYVPRSDVLSARMMLSEQGLPSRGSVGYEIFDNPDALGQTQFQQNVNRLRALEGELARTIASLDGVKSARVHLVLPERQLFARESEQPSASIVIALRRDPLTAGQVRAVRNLVASATPGLTSNRVTILDETGRLLAAATTGEGGEAAGDGVDARQAAYEERIRNTVTDIVEGIVGQGNARVQVSADMDFSRVTETQDRFDPEGRVARSTSTSEDESSGGGSRSGGATSAANVPDGAGASGPGSGGASSTRSSETVNYEISRTTRTEVSEGGRVKRLSVAVAVDGVTTPGAEGAAATWAARPTEDIQQIQTLVRSAVGFSEQRGDSVQVVSMRFARPAALGEEAASGGFLNIGSIDVMRLVEIGAAFIVGLVLVFFVLGPLVSGLIRGGGAAATARGGVPALEGPAAAVAAGGAPALPAPEGAGSEPPVDRPPLRVGTSTAKRMAEVVEQHPDESIQIIRGWLNNAI
jgi:flagellar M-ring protein FliF